jgi:esterase
MLGHSMGGKAAMMLVLTRPTLLRRLIVADIAPVAYDRTQMGPLDAMRGVDLAQVTKRSDAAAQMGDQSEALKAFLLQSLDLSARRWRLNLDVLARAMPAIMGFPAVTGQFDGPTLFLTGALSDYVLPAHHPDIRALFPQAQFVAVAGAGHWLHAEQPQAFVAAARGFLDG